MNYYEHHLGDYAQATAHLTFVEDAAYSRMLRKYYAEEKPLPPDLRSVIRLVGARTEEEREAVEIVLNEFFTLEEDGWHNSRADAEIARFDAKRQKAKKSAGARWNANAPKFDANAQKEHANASKNDANGMQQIEPEHGKRNALQSPDTSNQTPEKQKQARGTPARPDDVSEQTWKDWLALRKVKKAPITETVLSGISREAKSAGFTLEAALRTCCERGWAGFKAEWVARDSGNVRQFPAAKQGAQPEILPELQA